MDKNFEIFPSIYWTIPKYRTCKYEYRNLHFLDSTWVLELSKRPEGSSNRIKITLSKSIANSRWRTKQIAFQVHTSIRSSSKSKRFVKTAVFTKGYRYSELLIWSEFEENLKIRKRSVTFCIMITPVAACAWTDLPSYFTEKNSPLSEIYDSADCMLKLRNDFGELFFNGDYSDVVLKCNDQCFKAHKAILSARSDFFAAMFRNDMKESQQNIVEIKNMEPAILRELVYYLYTGDIPVLSTNSLRKLYTAADMYFIEALKIRCAVLIVSNYKMDHEMKSRGTEDTGSSEKNSRAQCTQLEKSNDRDKKLLRDLFSTTEWDALSPNLKHDMCKFLLLNRDL